MHSVLLICGYGFQNLGDEAMSLSVINRLRKAIPELQITVARNTPLDNESIPGCTRNRYVFLISSIFIPSTSKCIGRLYKAAGIIGFVISHFLLRFRVMRLLSQGWLYSQTGFRFTLSPVVREVLEVGRTTDMLYIAGGGNWNDIWLRDGLVARMIAVRFFRYFGKPVVISGQGVGPLKSRYWRRFLKNSLKRVDLITLRDFEESEKFLRTIGVSAPKIISAGDDSLGLEPASSSSAENLIREAGLDPFETIMGVHVRLTTYHKREILEYAIPIAEILDEMVNTFGVKILFIPTAFVSTTSWDDRDHSYRVLRHMRRRDHAAVVHNRYEASVCKAVIARCQMVLATGYHPCVFALSSGVPVIGLYEGEYYRAKMLGLFRFYDLDEYAIEYSEATPERVEKLFRTLLANKADFIQHAREVNSRIRKNIDVTISRSAELLNEQTKANT